MFYDDYRRPPIYFIMTIEGLIYFIMTIEGFLYILL